MTSSQIDHEVTQRLMRPVPFPIDFELSSHDTQMITTTLTQPTSPADSIILLTDTQRHILLNAVCLTIALHSKQSHKWNHHSSCFKKGIRKGMRCCICRYGKPSPPTKFTFVNEFGNIEIQSTIGSEYLNAYSPLIFSFLHSNSDVKVLMDMFVEYAVKYVQKPQNTIDSRSLVNALSRSYERQAIRLQTNPDLDEMSRGTALIRSFLYNLSNLQEVPSTMAALFAIRNKPPMYMSHSVQHFNLGMVVSYLDQHRDNCSVPLCESKNGDNYEMNNALLKHYMNRDKEYDTLSLYDFLRNGLNDSTKPKVVIFQGFTWRPKEAQTNDEKARYHALGCLIAFVPFRTFEDVIQSDICPSLAWENSLSTQSMCISYYKFITHMEDRWRRMESSRASAKKYLLHQKDQYDLAEANGEIEDNGQSYEKPTDGDVVDLGGKLSIVADHDFTDINEQLSQFDTKLFWMMKLFPSTDTTDTLPPPSSTQQVLQEADANGLPAAFISEAPSTTFLSTCTINNRCSNLADLTDGLAKVYVPDNTNPCNPTPLELREHATVTELHTHLKNAINDSSFTSRDNLTPTSTPQSLLNIHVHEGEPLVEVPRFPSINNISKAFTLTESQHLAFAIISSGLLWSIVHGADCTNDVTRIENQTSLLLHGLGGSGKTAVIRAWIALAQCWDSPKSVFTFAKTGLCSLFIYNI
jgi:hypothetical protein